MHLLKKAVLAIVIFGIVVSGAMLSGCAYFKSKNPETVSLQAKNAAATIDRQEARGRLTSTEAANAKDSLARDHLLQF